MSYIQLTGSPAACAGLHVATAHLVRGGEAHVLHVLEGPDDDMVMLLGAASSTGGTRTYRHDLKGAIVAELAALMRPSIQRGFRFRFVSPDSPRDVLAGEFSPGPALTAEAGSYFSAAAEYVTAEGTATLVCFPLMRQDGRPLVAILAVGLALACGGCAELSAAPPTGQLLCQPDAVSVAEIPGAGMDLLTIELRFASPRAAGTPRILQQT